MKPCLMFVLAENAKKMPWEEIVRFNCGTCRHWDPERQRCREEEKLKRLT